MAFGMDSGSYMWWIGRVETIYRYTGGRWSLLEHAAIRLNDLDAVKNIHVAATWYCPSAKRRTFKRSGAIEDADNRYSLQHYIGSPQLAYRPEKGHYALLDPERQLAALDAALAATVPK
eukprot:6094749-Prymnesium_polylepis.1